MAKEFAPSTPIPFVPRWSVVSVCGTNKDMNDREINREKMFTLLSRKASAKYCAPSAPIAFAVRSSVVSVYMRKM